MPSFPSQGLGSKFRNPGLHECATGSAVDGIHLYTDHISGGFCTGRGYNLERSNFLRLATVSRKSHIVVLKVSWQKSGGKTKAGRK